MFALKRLMPAASFALLLTLAACGDSLSPADVDPVALQSSMSDAAGTFAQNAVFQSVTMLSPHFPRYGAPALGLAGLTLQRLQHPGTAESQQAARRIAQLAASFSASPQALFPADILGKTLVWDANTNAYVVGNAPGAPATGIRILLYFTNAATGMPFLPITPIGSLDLTDKSTAQANRLGVTLAFGQTTVSAYDITVVSGTTSATVTAKGYLAAVAGPERIDFGLSDLIAVSGQTLSLTSTNDLTSSGAAIHVVLTQADIFLGAGTIVARISRGNATAELTVTGDLANQIGPLSGGVKFNNTTVATIGGTFANPAITGSGGHTFTAAQIDALLQIFGSAIDFAFDFSTGVLSPGTIVF